jgi:hypothetical protein
VIIKDDPNASDWYCAEIRNILADRIEVNYYTTITPALTDYKDRSVKKRSRNIKAATFLRTWCLDKAGYRLTHNNTAFNEPWKTEPFMVGKNSFEGRG